MTKLRNNSETLRKKQYAKYISRVTAKSLIYYNPTSPLIKAYGNTAYGCCENLIVSSSNRLVTTYCKNRWCNSCNRIKTAKAINNYHPQLSKLTDSVFVTLTLPTCTAEYLPARIEEMEKMWRLIYQYSKKAAYKKEYEPLQGVRKAECTIRPNHLYHYHFHLILKNEKQGKWLINQWLKRFPEASIKSQHIRPTDKGSFIELFKYAFKCEVKASNTNAVRYDVVFRALRNKRTYQAFGGIKQCKEDFDEKELVNGLELEGQADEIYKWCVDDWFRLSDGLALVNKEIPDRIKEMVKTKSHN
jgi:hypothetical protein